MTDADVPQLDDKTLADYVDGLLSPDEEARVREQMAANPASFKRALELDVDPGFEVPSAPIPVPDFIKKRSQPQPNHPEPRKPRKSWMVGAYAAAAGFLLALLLFPPGAPFGYERLLQYGPVLTSVRGMETVLIHPEAELILPIQVGDPNGSGTITIYAEDGTVVNTTTIDNDDLVPVAMDHRGEGVYVVRVETQNLTWEASFKLVYTTLD